jgi:GNAT superfamily N-acetyltransferase
VLFVKALSRVPELKPMVSAWLLSEWPTWYGEGAPGDLAGDVEAFAQSESSLPVGFVVFKNAEPVGFGALKQESIPSHAHLSPWAATGFVLPHHRGQGVGAFMLQSVVAHARIMGYNKVYCGTSTAASVLRRAGWREVDQVVHAGKPLSIFRSVA